jgi:pimeloyl-ACP methyl ester carboxylesterase
MTFKKRLLPALALAFAAGSLQANAAEATDAARCETLIKQSSSEMVIQSANLIAEGAKVPGARMMGASGEAGGGPELQGLPAFCRVVGSLRPEPGSDIGFEVWLPANGWDGRFHGIGIGGFAGSIDYMTLSGALKAGQASAATDTGHKGSPQESEWAKVHPERVRDHGWRAVHMTTVAAKQLIAGFYGRGPDRSYFVGCSGGGRQGLIEASRYPEDYDGIVSGAPAAIWTDMALSMINAIQAQQAPDAGIRPEQAKFLQAEVLNQCDAVDGQADGLVNDPRQCNFDVAKLACSASESPQCFKPAQIEALRKIVAGPHDSAGKKLANGYLLAGSESGTPVPHLGWEGYLLMGGDGKTASEFLAGGLLQNVIQQPFTTPETFDFDTDPARVKAAVAEDLERFFDRGGKLILWHGWADAAIPPEATLDLHKNILSSSGTKAADSVRLFMVPGLQHCFGGTGPDAFGQLGAPQKGATAERNIVSAMQSWVEDDRKPEQVIGLRDHAGFMGMPGPAAERQRLLCAHPATAVLKQGGNPDQASSYTCEESDSQ